jgi:glucose/arabinose dehydrogenase
MGNVKSRAALGSVLVVLAMLIGAGLAQATVPAGFGDETVFEGLSDPTMVRFAPDGRVFVAEKGGKILVFENLQDETPEVFADLSKPVYDYEDHGLLGIALDPLFDLGRPYVYAIYTFNHKLADPETQEPLVSNPEGVAPAWPSEGPAGPEEFEHDQCTEQGEEGCEVSGLVVRMTASAEGNHAVPSAEDPAEKVLIEGWCQQSTTHSIGNVGFGPEGNLFVSGGEGSMFSEPDYGQFGNPCGDPFEAPNGNPRRSKSEGGSLRSQSVLRNHSLPGHKTLLSGTVLRVNPDTGEGVPGNPFYTTSTEKNAKRIIAFGFRQPWRFAFNPRTSKLFVDNVGDGTFEQMVRLELNGAASYSDGEPAYNSGWPCYESAVEEPDHNEHYAFASEPLPTLQVCLDQYQAEAEGKPETSTPFFSYAHSGPITPGDPCDAEHTPTDIGGLSFYEGSNYPAAYKNSLFFADPIRGCIYVMKASPNGEPDPASVTSFVSGKSPFSFPGVDIEQGPEGDIFYTEFFGGPGTGTVHRITHAREETPGSTTSEPTSPTSTSTPPGATVQTPPGGAVQTPPIADGPPKLHRRPAKTTRSTMARFTFSAASGLTFRCSLDGTTFSRCGSPRIYKHLAVGAHTFRVFAVDSSGNRATATTKYSWTLKRPAAAR